MTDYALAKIVTHDAPGEFRAVAVNKQGHGCRLFLQRWGGMFDSLQMGDVVEARLRTRGTKHQGSFAETSGGETVLVTGALPDGVTEGAGLRVEIRAEARRDKVARGVVTTEPPQRLEAYAAWKASLPGLEGLSEHEDIDAVELAFDQALAPSVTLPGGGQIHIEATRALTAMDVDTSGRTGQGSAGARALSINRDAAIEAARHCALRDIGGAIVLDCVNPLNQSAKQSVAKAFQETFQSLSQRSVEVIPPSRFGLMQAALAWGKTPLAERLLEPDGQFTPETRLLALLRDVEREAAANGAALFQIDLSQSVFEMYLKRRDVCETILKERFGGRVQTQRSSDDQDAIRKRV